MRELNDQEKLTLAVIDRAKRNDHSKFEYIRSMAGLRAVSVYFNSVAKMKNGFIDISVDVMKRYCADLVKGSSDVKALITYNELKLCEAFYEEEQEIAREMIREYISYVSSGHMIEFMMGYERPEEELKDYIERRK